MVKTEVSSAVPSLLMTENVMAPQFTPSSRFVVIKESLHVRSLCGYQTFCVRAGDLKTDEAESIIIVVTQH